MENAGFTSVWHWKHSTGCDAFSSLSSVFPPCTLWQLMQPTPALAWGARSKFGCVPAWQPRQVASTCFSGSLASILILVTSPPPSTWALPDPWQLSQVTPWPPYSNASLECGLFSNFLTTSAWQVAQTSEPRKSADSGAAAFCATAACLFPRAAYPALETPSSSATNAIQNTKRFIKPLRGDNPQTRVVSIIASARRLSVIALLVELTKRKTKDHDSPVTRITEVMKIGAACKVQQTQGLVAQIRAWQPDSVA